ncbi:putative endo-1,4-beta-xylanase [Leadbettera azotonutricia ZAS-9]|uniref:endo-1,4-beta-xylanase n=2 Tax=Leadbettera azotonutricia TaxID=150829 RepID=F5YET3_LEAAZ|nr:putative endo-1,4-beta-xylanase [Leadbettera azotonutricia ZAS-9]
MKQIHVRLDDAGGIPMARPILESVYASDLEFEPDERRQRILPDGTVELTVTHEPYMIHAKIYLPLYGNIWIMADNEGLGYTGDFVDFVSEACHTYIREAEKHGENITLSPEAHSHLAAAKEFTHLADRGKSTAENRLYALSHAVYAAEAALFEASCQRVYANPRDNLLLGCNFFKYTSSDARYAKFFADAFDFATLPFYPGRTVPEKGKYTYEYIDLALEYLQSKNIKPKGHPIWFGHESVNPKWLFGQPFETLQKNAREIALHHVKAYKGRIKVWDAMNEAHDWANCFTLTQPQLVELTRTCCDALHEVDSSAIAVVNVCLPFAEYVAGRYVCYGSLPEKLHSPLTYFRAILDAGVQFDVTGIQLYFPARDMVAVDRMLSVFASLGKPVHITEMGVNGDIRGHASQSGSSWTQLSMSEGVWHGGWNEHTQADWLEQFYTIAAARPEIQALTWWDFIEPSFSGNGAFLYEDENPREMYFRLLALKDRIIKKRYGTV